MVLSNKQRHESIQSVLEFIELSEHTEFSMDYYTHYGIKALVILADTIADIHEHSIMLDEPEDLY